MVHGAPNSRSHEGRRSQTPLGSKGKVVEADETYYGPKDRVTTRTKHGKPGLASKHAVLALVERGGHVRLFFTDPMNAEQVRDILVRIVSRKSKLHTDESRLYSNRPVMAALPR